MSGMVYTNQLSFWPIVCRKKTSKTKNKGKKKLTACSEVKEDEITSAENEEWGGKYTKRINPQPFCTKHLKAP